MQVSAIIPTAAGVVELADTPALGAGTGRRRGSSPLSRKRKNKEPEDKSDVFGFSVFPVYFGNCGDLKRSVKDNPSRRRIGQRRRPEAEVLRSVRQVPSPATLLALFDTMSNRAFSLFCALYTLFDFLTLALFWRFRL